MLENDLSLLADQLVCATSTGRLGAVKSLMAALKRAVASSALDQVATILTRVISPTLDYSSAQQFYRIRSQLRDAGFKSKKKTRLAVLGSFTTTQLVQLIDLHLFAAGIEAEIYEPDFGVFRHEILDLHSGLYDFKPDSVYLATSWRDLIRRPDISCDRTGLQKVVEDEQAEWRGLWELLQSRLGCQVIQNNFITPPYRAFSNYEMRQPGSLGRYLSATNQYLYDNAPPFVTIHDVDSLSGLSGRWNWDDPRFVHQAKLPCAPEFLVDYAHNVASLVSAQAGLAKKCLVLDLDNTLWGGVIGDDGIEGIRIGQGDPEGEAYVAFQQYVKALQMRGIILAVCSKNNEETAKQAFEKHDGMILKLADISCFVANWDDKASNLRAIAETLNIGTNSLVFIDDNPAERSIVRRLVPEVAVPELPEDVAGYAQAIEQHRFFQVLSVGDEDLQRTQYYHSDSLRRSSAASAGDMESYLRSLEMIATVVPINPTTLERSVQLIHRSNQFNLTTRRRSASEILSLLSDETWITRTVTLADRFGNNGLICVLLARKVGPVLEIDTWLMSCRVLKRGVEQFLLNHLFEIARELKVDAIRGEFIPSAKNSLVRDHYAQLGFSCLSTDEDGRTVWELSTSEDRSPITNYIRDSSKDAST